MNRLMLFIFCLASTGLGCLPDDPGESTNASVEKNANMTSTSTASSTSMTNNMMTSTSMTGSSTATSTMAPMDVPNLEVSSEVVFSLVTLGESASKVLSIKNSGTRALQLKDIVISPLSQRDFKLTFPNDVNDLDNPEKQDLVWQAAVQPGESVPVRVVFEPQDGVLVERELLILSNDPDAPTTTVRLVGNQNDEPCIRLLGVSMEGDTSTLDFSKATSKSGWTKTFEVSNCSDQSVLKFNVSNTSETHFQVTAPSGLTNIELAPSETFALSVEYNPKEPGVHQGKLEFSTNDPNKPNVELNLQGSFECAVLNANAEVLGKSSGTTISSSLMDTVSLSASFKKFREIERYTWSFLSQPENSSATLTPSAQDATPSFMPDQLGLYSIELQAIDAFERPSCAPATLSVTAQ